MKWKPNYLLDEQMYFDAQTTLLFQIREELKNLNHNIASLNKPPEYEVKKKPSPRKDDSK